MNDASTDDAFMTAVRLEIQPLGEIRGRLAHDVDVYGEASWLWFHREPARSILTQRFKVDPVHVARAITAVRRERRLRASQPCDSACCASNSRRRLLDLLAAQRARMENQISRTPIPRVGGIPIQDEFLAAVSTPRCER